MDINLDLKNKRILYELDINSRQQLSEIAKKVGLSKQTVSYRIDKMIKENIILKFYSVIDISKLGFAVYKNFLKLQNLNHENEKKLITYLKEHPDVVWLASCDGKYDLAFGTWARDMSYLDRTLKNLDKQFGEFISERQIAPIIHGEYFVRDYFMDRKEPSDYRPSFFGSTPQQAKMDESNWKILLELGKNSRVTPVEISKKIKLSPNTIRNRIKELELSGVIKHYNIVPNEEKFSWIHYKVLIGLKNVSDEKEKMLHEFCRINPNIVYIVKTLGPWEFEIDIEVKNVERLREILMELKSKFSDIIKDYTSLHIYQVHKYNFCPSIPK